MFFLQDTNKYSVYFNVGFWLVGCFFFPRLNLLRGILWVYIVEVSWKLLFFEKHFCFLCMESAVLSAMMSTCGWCCVGNWRGMFTSTYFSSFHLLPLILHSILMCCKWKKELIFNVTTAYEPRSLHCAHLRETCSNTICCSKSSFFAALETNTAVVQSRNTSVKIV